MDTYLVMKMEKIYREKMDNDIHFVTLLSNHISIISEKMLYFECGGKAIFEYLDQILNIQKKLSGVKF